MRRPAAPRKGSTRGCSDGATCAWPDKPRPGRRLPCHVLSRVCTVIRSAELAAADQSVRGCGFSPRACANSARLARRRQPTLAVLCTVTPSPRGAAGVLPRLAAHDRRGRGWPGTGKWSRRAGGAADRKVGRQPCRPLAGKCSRAGTSCWVPPTYLQHRSGDPYSGSMGPYWRRWPATAEGEAAATLTPTPAPSGLQDLDGRCGPRRWRSELARRGAGQAVRIWPTWVQPSRRRNLRLRW